MKIRSLPLLLLVIFLAMPVSNVYAQEPTPPPGGWQYLRAGIDWGQYHLSNPREINIYVARMHRGELSATIDTGIAGGNLSSGKETTSGMAARYDDVLNYWGQTWGNRNDIAVAINGYFFDNDDGTPWSGVVNSSWYAQRFSDGIGDAGFAWTAEREAHIGSCVIHRANKNVVSFELWDDTTNIRGVNIPHDDERVILYTPQYGDDTGTGSDVLELLVEMTGPTQILPSPAKATGILRHISESQGSTDLPFDHVVISVWGETRDAFLYRINNGQINLGDEVYISQEISPCQGVPADDWTKTYASLGGDYHFLNDGVFDDPGTSDSGVPNSRTAVAYSADYVFFVVVDAFDCQPAGGQSRGMNIHELSNFLEGTLGATDAVTMDSGGSSTMVIDGAVVNNTTCNFTRNCGCAVEEGEAPPSQTILDPALTYKTEWDDPTGILEPLVGTSMMMVSVQPVSQTTTFTPTQEITTTGSADVRLGPGINYSSIGSVSSGTQGEVISDLNGVNGVLATGSYWWRVAVGNLVGWVRENLLFGGATPPGPTPTPTPTPTATPPPPDFSVFLYMPAINRAAAAVSASPQPVIHTVGTR